MNAIVIKPLATLYFVGTKSVDRRYVVRVAALVREEVETRFDGNQRKAAKFMPLSQTQISDYYNLKPGKGLGLPILLKLRDYFNRSLDDLLGLDPLPSEQLINQIRSSVEALMAGQELPKRTFEPRKPTTSVAPEGVSHMVPHGTSKAAAQANIQSRISAKKQNDAAHQRREVDEITRTVRRRKRDETG